MTESTVWVRVGRDRYGLIHVEVWSAAREGNGVVCDEIMIPADALAGLARYLTDAAETDAQQQV